MFSHHALASLDKTYSSREYRAKTGHLRPGRTGCIGLAINWRTLHGLEPKYSAPFPGPVADHKQVCSAWFWSRLSGAPRQAHFKWECEQLHDYVLFSANSGLRPDEARRLQFRDVTIVEDDALGQTILAIEVRGKRGVGYCKSMPGPVRPFEKLKARLRPARAYKRAGAGAEHQ